MSPLFALKLAMRSLVRGGQRTLLAASCVAFGVMSLVALELLSTMVATSLLVDSRIMLGGDAQLARPSGTLGAGDIAELERLRNEGVIAGVSLAAESGGGMLTTQGSGRVHILGRVLAVDPQTFPLVGTMRLRGEPDAAFGSLIAQPGAVVITRDVAARVPLATGDQFTMGGGPAGPPVRLTVAGIAEMPPDRIGDTVYYSLDTARRIAGRDDVATSARVLWGAAAPAQDMLEHDGWSVKLPEQVTKERARVIDLFGLLLKGSGVLGLLLGGIGVSNTMQVLLARRRLEIATLKSIGYERRHLVLLFGIEAAILGLAGAVAGAAAGVALSAWLRELLGRAGPFMLEQAFDPGIVAGGVLVGAATAVIFGLHAIARASAVRPATLLRDLPTPNRWGETIGLALVLGVLFSAVASLVLGSVVKGAGVVLGGFAGLVLLAALLGAGFLAVVSVPMPMPGLLSVARNNLRRQPSRVVVALVALFCGVFTIGFSGTVLSNARDQFARRTLPSDGVNLTVFAATGETRDARAALDRAGVTAVERMVTAPVTVRGASGRVVETIRTVSGADAGGLSSLKLVDGTWSADRREALAPARGRNAAGALAIGDVVAVEGATGATESVTISGFYESQMVSQLAPRPEGLVVDAGVAERLGGPSAQVQVSGHVDVGRLTHVAEEVGRALPNAMVLDRGSLNSALQGILESLFAFVIAVAGLALVAGGVLIANSAGLAMLERRREMGIFKAIGYSTERVLAGIAAEYTMLGVFAGIAGMGGVAVALEVINRLQHSARLGLDPLQAAVMVAVATAIALASALAVAWRPARARPLEVLRQE